MKRILFIALILIFITGVSFAQEEKWLTSWGNAPQLTEKRNMPPNPGISNSTLRQMFRVSVGGEKLRLQFSNAFGNGPIEIKAVEIAVSAKYGKIVEGTNKTLTFSGNPGVTITEKDVAWSDPLEYHIDPLADLAVTIWFGETPSGLTGHPGSRMVSYFKEGNCISDLAMSPSLKAEHWYVLTRLDVEAPKNGGAIVVLGDSITDGRGSSTNRNTRWPDNLAARLQETDDLKNISVVNMGIGGNAAVMGGLGPAAVKRVDRDVLDVAGVQWLIVLIGINDIGYGGGEANIDKTPKSIINAYERIIAQAKEQGIKVYGIPLLPIGGSQYDSEANRTMVETVNKWMYSSGKFGAIIPLENAVSDPAHPEKLSRSYDSNDHLHLNVAGYRKMADEIDLDLFRK